MAVRTCYAEVQACVRQVNEGIIQPFSSYSVIPSWSLLNHLADKIGTILIGVETGCWYEWNRRYY
jgi:hypothetical protein